MNFQSLFKLAMKRDLPELLPMTGTRILNLGEGNSPIPGTIGLDLPTWDADRMPIPYSDASVDGIYAFHFLEHCTRPVDVLLEAQRVLRPGGVFTLGVPYYDSAIAHEDLDHKKFFTEETFRMLFQNTYYNKNKIEWKFRIHFNMVAFIVQRNQILLTQLERLP